MSDTIRIKPAKPGLIVRDPVTRRPLAEEGEDKPRHGHEMYWMRRLRDGDVVLVEGEPAKEEPHPDDQPDISPMREA